MQREMDNERNVVPLQGREIPRNTEGDPNFPDLPTIQAVFTDEEITIMVNRALYQAEYQRDHHKLYSQKVREREKPYKQMAKRMFPGTSWVKLTSEQLNSVFDAVHAKKEE